MLFLHKVLLQLLLVFTIAHADNPPPPEDLLVRCSWRGHDIGVECPPRTCQASTDAYSQFLFDEVRSALLPTAVGVDANILSHRLMESDAYCFFLTRLRKKDAYNAPAAVCACRYTALKPMCPLMAHIAWRGDSTAQRFRDHLRAACNHKTNVLKLDPQTKVVVVSEKTLHYLYLPFVRESDVQMKGEEQNMLFSRITSVEHYQDVLNSSLTNAIRQYDQAGINVRSFVYMANNEVCPDAYTDGYHDSWRWLMGSLNKTEIARIAQDRGGDELSALGFTLDHYGSMFVSALAKSFVLKHFPQIKYFQLAARYPANCVLSSPGDGRHFGQGTYYLAKARMLVHVVGNASFH